MSGAASPQMLPAPRKRGMRRLTKLPAFAIVAAALILTVLLILVWRAIGSKIAHKDDEDYALAAHGTLIPHRDVIPPPSTVPAVSAPVPQAPPPDPMAQIRKEAWDLYYQEWREHNSNAHKAQFDAYTASPTGATSASGSGSATGSPQIGPNGQSIFPGQPGYAAPGSGGSDRDRQLAFINAKGSDPSTDYLTNSQGLASVTHPISRWEIKAGTVISGTLISKMNSDTPGEMIAQVSRPVFDDQTGTQIMIPQGARLIGTYDTAISYGQTRLVAGFTRIIFPPPGSESLDIGMMGGSDQEGAAGFSDITNNHFGKIFLNAGLLALFSAGIQLSQPQPVNGFGGSTYSSPQIAAGAAAQQLGQLGMEFARRGLDIPPTQEIRKGYAFNILVTKDIVFPGPWHPGHPAVQQVNAVQ